jgi:hypothetical protein
MLDVSASPQSIYLLVQFWGVTGLLKALKNCRVRLERFGNLDVVGAWRSLGLPNGYRFAYTCPYDGNYLNKFIFVSRQETELFIKSAHDPICADCTANELKASRQFPMKFKLLSEAPLTIATPFRPMVGTPPLSKRKLVRLIESFIGEITVGEQGLYQGLSHGDLTRRNIKGKGLFWLRPYVIDYEFVGRRSISYDYFFYFISPYMWRRELAPILRFAKDDRHAPLVIAGHDLSAQYDRYLNAFVDEWADFVIPSHHDQAEKVRFQSFIQALKHALATTR